VILGGAGAGQTVMAVDFVRHLLKRRQPGEVVPVRLAPSQWDPDVALERWMAESIAGTYGLRRRRCAELLRNRMVLPVPDGLARGAG
jgi:hypothetical protein